MNKHTIFECVKSKKETLSTVTKQTAYYLSYYDDIRRNKTITKWNTSAFLFSAYWLLYRKMYLDFFTYVAFTCVSEALYTHVIKKGILFFFGTGSVTNDISIFFLLTLKFIPSIFYGFYGNYLYFLNIEKRLQKNKSQGTNIIAPIILVMFLLLVLEKMILIKSS
ncbi:MAG: hypothetical protein C0432_04980 [Candidatus Puniceispirillum sp.]|nr:hypothetical protein [Candidatus Pelagibacter sp.]MBA4283628.1 hypothetical protein [Candidatus Puniceispirillum sp.]